MIAGPCEFWRDHSGNPHVTIPTEGFRRHFRVNSSSFIDWLRHQYYLESKKGVPPEAMKMAISTLSAKAIYEGACHKPALRVGWDEIGDFWIDLCDDKWSAVRVSILGWERVERPLIRFLRHPGMEALPEPVRGRSIDPLWRFINCAEEDRILVLGFLLNVLHPTGPYYGLNLFGSKGSAKSTATRLLRSLVDPNEAFSQSMPTSAENLAVSAQGQWILAFENLSKLSEEESDLLCRLSTGDAFRRRKLYSDQEETIIRSKRPWIVNSIPNVVGRGDLIDRSLSVEMLVIDREQRREEGVIIEEFRNAIPGILGALLDGVELALKSLHEVRVKFAGKLPRMADVALWITAAEPALGYKQGSFLARHAEMASGSSAESAEGNSVAETIIRLAERGWDGYIKCLLEEIKKAHPDDRFIPQTPKALGNAINRLQSDLWEAHGVRIKKLPRQSGGCRVRIWKDVHQVHDLHEAKMNGELSGGVDPACPVDVHHHVHPTILAGVGKDEQCVCHEHAMG